MDQVIGKIHILDITPGLHLPAFLVAVGMVSYGMSFVQYLLVNIRMLFHIFSETEKSRFETVAAELFQYPGCHVRGGAVVESQVDILAVRKIPDHRRKDFLDYAWWTESHLSRNGIV